MDLTRIRCPNCQCQELEKHTTYTTKNYGDRIIYKCKQCKRYFSQTKNTFMEGLSKPISLVVHVINARTEGLGLNAACQTFSLARNTILKWERRFADIKPTLMLYTLVHEFLEVTIEGDEIYTKIKRNVPADESRGWTIILMERASRFILELRCGRKERRLFRRAIRTLCKLIKRAKDLSLLTDGERRYGNLLFEMCQELIRNGKRGRPRRTLPKGVKVRIKNKGSQAHKRGPKRPKYQAPWPEHPETVQDIADEEIHANHVEGFNSSLRRRNAAYRRKTNTYAKVVDGLQRTLDVCWIVHNFVRVHFTTRKVPAVALGILEKGLSLDEIFMIQKVA